MFLSEADEPKLMRKVAKGDKVAFRDLALVYQKPLHNFCLKMMGGLDHAAEDVLQHVLIIWWQKAPLWNKSRGSLKAWLFTIAANKCKDFLRTHKHGTVELNDDHLVADSMLDDFMQSTQRVALLKVIDKLSAKQKEVVWLVYFEEMKQFEVANKLGVNLKAVESNLNRAKIKMRHELKDMKEALL